MNFTFTKTRDDISPEIGRLVKLAKNPTPVLRAMGTTFKAITEGNFNSVGASYRPRPWKNKRDGTPSILQKSTTLAKSFNLQVTSTSATLSNPTIYAAAHQFGVTIRPKSGKALRFQSGGKWYTVKQVVIPARPFYPVLDGRLTAAAEQKIINAGERVLLAQQRNA